MYCYKKLFTATCTAASTTAVFVSQATQTTTRAKESNEDDWSSSVPLPKGETVKKLFNGRTLEGWRGHKGTHFNVINNEIVGQSHGGYPNGAPRASTYLMTTTKHRNFRLLLEAKIEGESDVHTGIAMLGERCTCKDEVHSYKGHLVMIQDPRVPTKNINSWGLFELMRRNWSTGSVSGNWCPNGGHIQSLQTMKNAVLNSANGWHRMEILVRENRILVGLNGVEIINYIDPNPELMQHGPIGLQLHWLPLGDERNQKIHFKGLCIVDRPLTEQLVSVIKEVTNEDSDSSTCALPPEQQPSWIRTWKRRNSL